MKSVGIEPMIIIWQDKTLNHEATQIQKSKISQLSYRERNTKLERKRIKN